MSSHPYPPAERCIYCGVTGVPLSKEHVIPFALGGELVLRKASCEQCASHTQKIEETCMARRGGMLYSLRAKFNFPSRGKWKQGRDVTTQVILPDGTQTARTFKGDVFPAVAYALEMPIAGFLTGLPPVDEDPQFNFETIGPPDHVRPFLESYPEMEGASLQLGTFEQASFLRMVAKIAYAYAAAELGADVMLSELADLILGRSKAFSHLIGSGISEDPDVPRDSLHRLSIVRRFPTMKGDASAALVFVQLFAEIGLPSYHVVVCKHVEN